MSKVVHKLKNKSIFVYPKCGTVMKYVFDFKYTSVNSKVTCKKCVKRMGRE
jgi:hypothetical protein